jgi:hypothetical protein
MTTPTSPRIIKLHDDPTDEIVKDLEELIEAAEEEKFESLAVLAIRADGSVYARTSISDKTNLFTLIGGLTVLTNELTAEFLEREE